MAKSVTKYITILLSYKKHCHKDGNRVKLLLSLLQLKNFPENPLGTFGWLITSSILTTNYGRDGEVSPQ